VFNENKLDGIFLKIMDNVTLTTIKYPREATIFASVCAILFCIIGVVGCLFRSFCDDFGADSVPEVAVACDNCVCFVTVYIGSFVLHREPSANCVEVHPRGLDLRRRSLQTFPRVVLRKCGRFSSQYGRDNIKQVNINV
jgi:amino acid permease